MPRLRKVLPAHNGSGELRCRSFQGAVDYEILGDPSSLRLGPLRLRGSFNAAPDVAAECFRDGEGDLTLATGEKFRITMLGHTEGSVTTYFEMRV